MSKEKKVQEWFFFSFTKRKKEQNKFATMLYIITKAGNIKLNLQWNHNYNQ